MGKTNKEPNEPEPDPSLNPAPSSSDPEAFSAELDSYQERIQSEWEAAKSSYQSKINQILDNFIQEKMNAPEKDLSVVFPNQTDKTPRKNRLESLMDKAQQALHRAEEKAKQLAIKPSEKPSIINLEWPSSWESRRPRMPKILLMVAVTIGLFYAGLQLFHVPPISRLPYIHSGAIFCEGNQIYIADWFRKSLYVHRAIRGLSIVSIESLPNEFISGLCKTSASLWSLNGFTSELVEHENSTEHMVQKTIATPGPHAIGLYFDGSDLWTMDESTQKLYRYQGTDPSEVKEEYKTNVVSPTGFVLNQGLVYVLIKKSRLIELYRLEDPLRKLESYDLDPFLKGATPTALTIHKNHAWITTENPSQLVKISLAKLKKASLTHHS